jgi:type I restriction enzyme S subunit
VTSTPPGWTRCILSDVGEIKGGLTLGKKRRPGEGVRDVPYLRVANVQRGKLDLTEIKVIAATEREIDELRLQPGDILMNEGGDRDKLGRGWVWSGEMPECIHQNHVFRVRAFNGVESRFVSYYANSAGQSHFQSSGRQTTNLASVNKTTLSALSLPLPPSKEQRRIVAKLDAILERTRAAKARLERLPALLEKLKRSILAAAFRGDLTKHWRAVHANVEPASVLLERICTERRRRWEDDLRAKGKDPKKSKYEEPMQTTPIRGMTLPDTWEWTTLGHVSWSVKDGPHFSPPYVDDGVPFLSGRNIHTDGIDFSTAKFISHDLHEELSKRCKPEPGDLLYTKGGTTGIACVNTETRDFNVWVHVAVVKLVNSVSAVYLRHALNAPDCYAQAQRFTHGVGNQDLGLTRMIKIVLPVTPYDEQLAIVDRIDAALEYIKRLEARARTCASKIAAFEQALLGAAFRGELVPQDPNDEPATALLERIRAARAAEPGAPRRSRATGAKQPAPTTAEPTNGHATLRRDEPLDLVVAAFQLGESRFRATEIADATGLDAAAVKRALAILVDTGQVRVHGRARGTTYEWSP